MRSTSPLRAAYSGIASVNDGAVETQILAPPPGACTSRRMAAGNWSFLHNGAPTAAQSIRSRRRSLRAVRVSFQGVRRVAPIRSALTPSSRLVRSRFWRSADGGASWTQIKPSLEPADSSMRPELAAPGCRTGPRQDVRARGASGNPTSRLFRSDSVASGATVFVNLSSSDVAIRATARTK